MDNFKANIRKELASQKELMLIGIESIGLHIYLWANKRSKTAQPKAVQAPQIEETTTSTEVSVKKPAISPSAIADAIVRYIEVDLEEINRVVTRSPEFRAGLEKTIREV